MQEIRHQLDGHSEEFTKKFYVAEGFADIDLQMKAMQKAMDDDLVEGDQVIRRIKVGRNQECPCGSGKKFKRCCIHKAKRVLAL